MSRRLLNNRKQLWLKRLSLSFRWTLLFIQYLLLLRIWVRLTIQFRNHLLQPYRSSFLLKQFEYKQFYWWILLFFQHMLSSIVSSWWHTRSRDFYQLLLILLVFWMLKQPTGEIELWLKSMNRMLNYQNDI